MSQDKSDRNLLLAKYFHKMLYYQTTTNSTKIKELQGRKN